MRDGHRRAWVAAAVLATSSWFAVGASAQTAGSPQGIWERETLTGDWGGARTALKDRGLDFTAIYIGETLGILSGGLQRGTTFEGRLELATDADLDKLAGWQGASAHVKVYQIHNVNNRNALDYVGSLADPSNIDALPTTRLFTAWFQQTFASDTISVRFGQLAADDEFLTSTTAAGLINGTFGWAAMMAANMKSGGPAYPLATPGIRLQVKPTNEIALLAAVFSGDPAGDNCTGNPQVCNRYGLTFSTSGGTLWIGEVQYGVNLEKDATGLASSYKLGGWHATAGYPHQRFGLTDAGVIVSRADPAFVDDLNLHGDWGIYGVVDQMIWRGSDRSVSVFVRSGVTPSNRNLVSYYIDGGIGVKGPIPGRADDTLTFGIGHSKISKDAVALDLDTLALNGAPYPIRSSETVFELSYMAQIAPWWIVQPDVQYIVRPGGNVPDPSDPARAVRDAFLLGVRSTIKF